MANSSKDPAHLNFQINIKINPNLINNRHCNASKLQFCRQMSEYLNIMHQIDNAIVELDEDVSDIFVNCSCQNNIALIKKLISYTIQQERFPFFSHSRPNKESDTPISSAKTIISSKIIDKTPNFNN